jgi:integration host factor subunit alpha
MAMTKNDIVERLWGQLDCARKDAIEITESIIEIIKSTLETGEDVLVSGFGKFCVKEKTERRGRNPATGEDKILAARRVVTFKCSAKLREKVNGK